MGVFAAMGGLLLVVLVVMILCGYIFKKIYNSKIKRPTILYMRLRDFGRIPAES
jgi:hypothetical protein